MLVRLKRPRHKIRATLLLNIGLLAWLAACTPTVAEAPAFENRPYTLYLHAWTEDNQDNRLIPLDPDTLDDRPEGMTMELGRTWRLSLDGSTLVHVEYTRGFASLDLESRWIVVEDFPSGTERGRFHPPATGLVTGLSDNGDWLLLQADADPFAQVTYPPTVDWYVMDTSSGQTVAHVQDDENACLRQHAQFHPLSQRIYCIVDPFLSGVNKPVPMQIIMYSAESGRQIGDMVLTDVLLGGSVTEGEELPIETFLEPAVALSPDGQRLAIVHAEADAVTLVRARDLSVEKTFSLKRSEALQAFVPFAPMVAHAKSEMLGTIRHASFGPDGRMLYVSTQEVVPFSSEEPPEMPGLWLVDLQAERVVAEALAGYQIQWVQPAPDGTVFVFGTTDERLGPHEIRHTSPSTLWRLDGRTLDVLAQRTFAGFRGGQLIIADTTDRAQ